VILRLTSTDRVHGFLSKPFKIDTDIPPDKTTDIAVTPATAGNFTIICDHYYGTGPQQHEDKSDRRPVSVTTNH
jgi:heme/copper-type cytochrome/quinol oxidase subunit 2